MYLNFLADRSKGKILTDAKFMRNYVLNHPGYKKDSLLTDEILYDMSVMLLTLE